MLLLCFARICAASNPLLLWVLNRDLRFDIVGRDGCLTPGKCPYIKKTAILTQCPVRRPLSEYVRSSEESGCKCHALRSAAPALLLLKKVHTSRPNIWGSRPYFDPYLSIPPSDSRTAFMTAAALLMHSVYSFSGTESATMPAPERT